jgi:hypothetical protein
MAHHRAAAGLPRHDPLAVVDEGHDRHHPAEVVTGDEAEQRHPATLPLLGLR